MATPKIPRGIKNKNPGNIRHGDKWQGLAPTQPDPDFCTFVSPEYGIRAMCVILRNYQRKYSINTIAGIISRWAPPTENDTDSYIRAVARACGAHPNERITVDAILPQLIPAIIRHENGQQPYSGEVIAAGIAL